MVEVLPRRIKVGPYWFTIRRDSRPDAETNWGECELAKKNINIGVLCDPQQTSVTLLHELLHACEHVCETKLKHDDLSRMAVVLAQMLQGMGRWPQEAILEGERA